MKTNLIIILLILFTLSSNGQLQIDAGDDQNICLDDGFADSIQLGGNPTAFGGVEPYTYKWSTNHFFVNHSWGASYYLDDTTSANPKILNYSPDSLKFILTVTDDSANQAIDSVIIRFASFTYGAMDYYAFINPGDTVILRDDVLWGLEPFMYSWTPNYNISDTLSYNPRAWPYVSTDYKVITFDKFGCASYPYLCHVYVTPSNNAITKEINAHSTIFPNPIENSSVIFFESPKYNKIVIRIFNTNGRIIFTDDFNNNYYKIGGTISESGSYFYVISYDSGILSYGKFVKK